MTLPFNAEDALSHPFSLGNNNHAILGNPNNSGSFYADIAARDADTDFQVPENVGKAVAVTSPLSIFVLMFVGPAVWVELGSGDPIDTFLELTDVLETTYTGFGLNAVRVNAAETGLEFTTDDAGDVIGPGSSTDNALARFDLTTGKLIQNSLAILNDAGVLSGLTGLTVLGQTGIGTISPDAAALLDLVSTTQGFYPMRMTTTERDLIASPPIGLQIDNITTNSLERFDGAVWQNMAASGDLFGPGSSTDKSVPFFSGLTGKLLADLSEIYIPSTGRLGINTATVPRAGVGIARFGLHGVDMSESNGAHYQITTDLDDFPLFQGLFFGHDNMAHSFDAYLDAAIWKSSDVGSNIQFYKTSDAMLFRSSFGFAPGSGLTWKATSKLLANGQWLFSSPNAVPVIVENPNLGGLSLIQIKDTLSRIFFGFYGGTPLSQGVADAQFRVGTNGEIEIASSGNNRTDISFHTANKALTALEKRVKVSISGVDLTPSHSLYQEVYPSTDKQALALSCQDLLDRSPFGNDMTLEGSALIADGAGQFGKGLRLDATSGTFARVLDDISLQFTDAITVQCRIFANLDNTFQTIISKMKATATGNGWSFNWSSNTLRIVFRKNNNTTVNDIQFLGTLVPLTWHDVAFTFLESTLNLITYIDGLEIDNRTLTAGYTDSGDAVLIGDRFSGGVPDPAAVFNGDITNARIYNRVLLPEEIRTGYLR